MDWFEFFRISVYAVRDTLTADPERFYISGVDSCGWPL